MDQAVGSPRWRQRLQAAATMPLAGLRAASSPLLDGRALLNAMAAPKQVLKTPKQKAVDRCVHIAFFTRLRGAAPATALYRPSMIRRRLPKNSFEAKQKSARQRDGQQQDSSGTARI